MKKKFLLSHPTARVVAQRAIMDAPEGYSVVIEPATRNLEQNAKFHAICHELSTLHQWRGVKRSINDWKCLLVSGHSIASGEQITAAHGIEDEVVVLRESTSSMSRARMCSLIEYSEAFLSSLSNK